MAAQGGRSDVSGDASGNASGNAISYVSGNASGDATFAENSRFGIVNKKDEYADLKVGEGRKCYIANSECMEDIIIETLSEVQEDALSRVNYAYERVSSEKSNYVLMTYNYNQTQLNARCEKMGRGKFEGTCAEVAITSLVEYYHRKNRDGGRLSCVKGKDGKVDLTGDVSVWIYQYLGILSHAIAVDAYDQNDPEGGTITGKMDDIISGYYKGFGKGLRGNIDLTFLESKIESYNEKAKPVIGNLTAPNDDGHSVVIAGYYDIKVEYKKKASDKYKSKVYRYYVINDGWHTCDSGNYRVQYVRDEYLESSLNRMV